jgi:hypothetical protein
MNVAWYAKMCYGLDEMGRKQLANHSILTGYYPVVQETFGTGSAAQSEAGKKGAEISGMSINLDPLAMLGESPNNWLTVVSAQVKKSTRSTLAVFSAQVGCCLCPEMHEFHRH